jgi:pimeloyl-ACP methyl ester carboxylesterase
MSPRFVPLIILIHLSWCLNALAQQPTFAKRDFMLSVGVHDSIAVREIICNNITNAPAIINLAPILLVHGSSTGGLVCFDLDWKGNSFAEQLAAEAGCSVYVMDVRGWGKSSRPAALSEAPEKNSPLVSMQEAASDVATVIRWIANASKRNDLQLFGWATGGTWCAYALANDTALQKKIGSLVLLNTMYAAKGAWELRNGAQPEGAYRLVTAEGFTQRWNGSIPSANKSDWREDEVEQAYSRAALEADPTHAERTPSSARVPLGYWHEHVRMSKGEKFWDARKITVPTLLVRGELDFWSRPVDVETMQTEMLNARELQTLILSQGTHVVFLDKPERGLAQMIAAMLIFRE